MSVWALARHQILRDSISFFIFQIYFVACAAVQFSRLLSRTANAMSLNFSFWVGENLFKVWHHQLTINSYCHWEFEKSASVRWNSTAIQFNLTCLCYLKFRWELLLIQYTRKYTGFTRLLLLLPSHLCVCVCPRVLLFIW